MALIGVGNLRKFLHIGVFYLFYNFVFSWNFGYLSYANKVILRKKIMIKVIMTKNIFYF